MFLAIQVALVVLGLCVISRGRFEIGSRIVANPIASLVGIVLAGQLPIAYMLDIGLSLAGEPSLGVAADANWWVHPLVTCGAFVLAAVVTAIALRTDEHSDDVMSRLRPLADNPPGASESRA